MPSKPVHPFDCMLVNYTDSWIMLREDSEGKTHKMWRRSDAVREGERRCRFHPDKTYLVLQVTEKIQIPIQVTTDVEGL
jgi:hypothetical protein